MSSTTGDGRRRVDGLRRWLGAMLLGGLMAAAVGPVHAATVSNLNDAGAGSLRDAVVGTPAGGTVDFAPGLTGTITLTGGQITIDKALTITGPGASSLSVVDAGGRVFEINAAGAAVGISGLRLTGSGLPVRANGGAILNTSGLLTLDAVRISGSSVQGDWMGGGIGGAIASFWSAAGTSLTVRGSTIDGNSATKAGAIHAYNQAVVIENSTISGNTATDSGGAISFDSSWGGTTIRQSTIYGNQANIGSGVYARNGSSVTFFNSIVAGNSDPGGANDIDRGGGSMSATGSLFSELNTTLDINGTDVNNQFGASPMLGALADNGGTTPTLLPQATSPAIDAADCVGISPDQRGVARPQGARCDNGAVEVLAAVAPSADVTPVPALDPLALLLLSALLGGALLMQRRR